MATEIRTVNEILEDETHEAAAKKRAEFLNVARATFPDDRTSEQWRVLFIEATDAQRDLYVKWQKAEGKAVEFQRQLSAAGRSLVYVRSYATALEAFLRYWRAGNRYKVTGVLIDMALSYLRDLILRVNLVDPKYTRDDILSDEFDDIPF